MQRINTYRIRLLGHVVRANAEEESRENPVIDWCDYLTKARKKQSCLEACVKASRNPIIRLLMVNCKEEGKKEKPIRSSLKQRTGVNANSFENITCRKSLTSAPPWRRQEKIT